MLKYTEYTQQSASPAQVMDSWKKLAVTIAKAVTGCAISDHTIYGTVKTGRMKRVQHVLNAEGWPLYLPNLVDLKWEGLLDYIKSGRGLKFPVSVLCDLYVQDCESGKRFAFFLKDPLFEHFTSDRRNISKMLYLSCMDELKIDVTYLVIPYSLEKSTYPSWNPWSSSLVEKARNLVLIGDQFWQKLDRLAS